MKPAPTETADIPNQLRQQLILAQVRIMELEDVSNEMNSRLAETNRTLTELQLIAQARLAERDHLACLSAELEKRLSSVQQQLGEARLSLQQGQIRESELQAALQRVESTATERKARIDELEIKFQAIKTSRSWRWTAWLRGGKSP